MQKITPCLWFDTEAKQAAEHYVSIFKNSRIKTITHYGEGMPLPAGTVMTVAFELDGQPFMGLNGGPLHPFTNAVSFMVDCADQREIDEMWRKLSAGGSEIQCGWLKDKFGLSWQVVPAMIGKLMSQGDARKTAAMMQVLVGMVKLDIAALQTAYDNG